MHAYVCNFCILYHASAKVLRVMCIVPFVIKTNLWGRCGCKSMTGPKLPKKPHEKLYLPGFNSTSWTTTPAWLSYSLQDVHVKEFDSKHYYYRHPPISTVSVYAGEGVEENPPEYRVPLLVYFIKTLIFGWSQCNPVNNILFQVIFLRLKENPTHKNVT